MAGSFEPRPGTALVDVLAQAWRAILGRPLRSLLTAAGVSLGVAAAVTTIGVTGSAAGAISDQFDALRATQVVLRYPDGPAPPTGEMTGSVRRLNGVAHAGVMCHAVADSHRVAPVADVDGADGASRVSLVAAQPEALDALGVTLVSGRMFDGGHGERRDPVALVDTVTASDIGIFDAAGQVVYLDGEPVSVLGVYEAPRGEPRFTAALIVPYEACAGSGGTEEHDAVFGPPVVTIRTALGAADQVAEEAKLAIHPSDPDALVAVVPPDLRSFRQGVEGDARALFLGLSLVSLIIGALGVSNTTLVSVLERRSEIGLRRAVGASRRAVAAQFVIESALIGIAGGLLGAIVAVNVTALVALSKGWLIVLAPSWVAAGPLMGLAVGVVAGAYPAWKASRVVPAASLRA